MSITVTTALQVTVAGDGYGPGPLFTNSAQNLAGLPPTSVQTANGPITVNVPATAAGFVIKPPLGSTITKTIKGVSGDTGITWANAGVVAISLTPGAVASFVITANGVETLEIAWQ